MYTIKSKLALVGRELKKSKKNIIIDQKKIKKISNKVEGEIIKCDIALPAFINSHIHIGDSFLYKKVELKDIDELFGKYGLKQRKLESADKSTIISGIKKSLNMLEYSGTTTFCDFREGGIDGINILKDALEGRDIRSIILGRPKKTELKDKVIKQILDICDGLGLRSPNDWRDSELDKFKKISKGKYLTTHVSETKEVIAESEEKFNLDDLIRAEKYFDILVHGNCSKKISDKPIIVCPRSNFKMNLDLPKIEKYIEQKKLIALGTDNCMLNRPNLFSEMKFIQKNYQINEREILKMASTIPSEIFKIKTGKIESNFWADLILLDNIDLNSPYKSIIDKGYDNIKDILSGGRSIYAK